MKINAAEAVHPVVGANEPLAGCHDLKQHVLVHLVIDYFAQRVSHNADVPA